MRAPWIALIVSIALFCLFVVPARLAADEPPAKEEAKPGEKAEDPAAEAEEEAPKPPTTKEAYSAMQMAARKLPYAQRAPALRDQAQAFLDEWTARGATATGEDLYYLGQLHRTAEKYVEALAAFAAVGADEAVEVAQRDLAVQGEASLWTNTKARAAMDAAALRSAMERLLAYADGMTEENRLGTKGSLVLRVASVLDATDRKDEAMALRMRVVMEDPSKTGSAYRSIVHGLLGASHEMGGYDAMRRAISGVLPVLKHQQGLAVASAQTALDDAKAALEAGGEKPFIRTKETPSPTRLQSAYQQAQRRASGAKSLVKRLDGATRPFAMLGQPAPAWTLEKALGDVQQISDLKGKVVVLDFWATWCGWCVKSFPAIRDLLRDYGDQGLVVVGVTASSGMVFEHRYDLDDDFKDKVAAASAEGGYKPKPGARLANARSPADGKLYFEADAYREKEHEVLAIFKKNHEMTWPVVMIDKTEPSPKYALTGWPHAVVLDRQGRVRYFKSGALLRDRPEAVAAFRKVLEDLLAEPGGP